VIVTNIWLIAKNKTESETGPLSYFKDPLPDLAPSGRGGQGAYAAWLRGLRDPGGGPPGTAGPRREGLM